MLKRFVRRLVVDQLQRQESLRTRLHRLLNDAENGTSGMAETESVPIVEAPPAEPVEPPLPEGVVQSIHLEYPVRPRCRFPESQSYPEVYRILNAGRERYRQWLASFNQFQQFFLTIPKNPDPEQPSEPYWLNGFMENLDPIALYSLVALHKPKRYVEIGSGNSTKFVRRAIRDHDLKTTITSLDPNPRAEIDSICDRCLRISLEDSDLTLFQELEEGDIVFMDGSHRVFPNSDATVFFLEVLPAL